MRTVDLRVLLPDDVDPERFVERLSEAARHHEVLGAVGLISDGFGRLVPAPQVYVRPNTSWRGQVIDPE